MNLNSSPFLPARRIVIKDGYSRQLADGFGRIRFNAALGIDVEAGTVWKSLFKNDILTITRHECSEEKALRILLRPTRYDVKSVDITLPSSSDALSLLHTIDYNWPDVRVEYCDCVAALLSTCARPLNANIDRLEWPSLRLTLVEWTPGKQGLEMESIETDVVAMKGFWVFHPSGKHESALLIRQTECLFAPVPISAPFIGTKLHLSSQKYAYAKLEISKKSDLSQFMNTMLYPWEQMITPKRPHSGEDENDGGRMAHTYGAAPMAFSSFAHGAQSMNYAGSYSNQYANVVPAVGPVGAPPIKRIRTGYDIISISATDLSMPAVNAISTLTISNMGPFRAMFRITVASRTKVSSFGFSPVNGYLESGQTQSISITRKIATAFTQVYILNFARAPSGTFKDASEAFKVVLAAGQYDFTCRAV